MKNNTLIFFTLLTILSSCNREIHPIFEAKQKLHYSNSWERLDNYPPKAGRSDDLFFFNPEEGFIINSLGKLSYTEDGGETWDMKFEKRRTFFRCLTFKDRQTGWLGTLGTGDNALPSVDTIAMYETKDGGENWTPTKFNGPYPKGLCGLQTVSDDVIVGCGRVRGPSYFIKTEDGGKTWNSYDYNHLAGSLIAPYFYDEQHGLLIGGTTTDKKNCHSLILETFDGGSTWDTMYVSKQKGEYCWKVSFPTEKLGFISIQRNVRDGYFYVLQTKDGGKSWFENVYIDEPDYVQGIGFINDKVGWMGGSNKWTMETRDGGETWLRMADIGRGFNKFQFFGDSLAYGVGFGVFKMEQLNPVANGIVKDYYDNGKMEASVFYKNGKKDGNAQFYFENGTLKSKGQLKGNLRNKSWVFYDEKGNQIKKLKYKNGTVQIPEKTLQSYVGKYQVEEDVFRRISYKEGKLYSKISTSKSTHEIIPISDREFVYGFNDSISVEFVFDENGKVIAHLMKTRSGAAEAVKVE